MAVVEVEEILVLVEVVVLVVVEVVVLVIALVVVLVTNIDDVFAFVVTVETAAVDISS